MKKGNLNLRLSFKRRKKKMNRKKIFSAAFVLMFTLVSFLIGALEAKNSPVAVSPGSDTEVALVWQSCPTFSWSAVDQASSYRIAVFEAVDSQVTEYEGMVALKSPVVIKDIPGPALSWTLSSETSLKIGSMYAWYVRAMDAYGNALGSWSDGRIFKVEQEVRFAGIEEKLAEKLRSYGVDEETIANVLTDMKSEVKEVVVRSDRSKDFAKDTQGKSSVQGYEGIANTFYGQGAGFSNTSGTGATFIGANAGHSNTTGIDNTFLGRSAGRNNTNGGNNTFVGQAAGYQNISGNYNTFLGYMAGFQNTTGYDNTFIGESAGYNNIGHTNTFIGRGAGYSNTGGGENIFIGKSSGNSNTTGCTSIFLGNFAGYNNSTANNNIFIGESSGYSNTTGNGNIYLGNATGYNNTIGTGNIFLGDAAGFTNTTGSYNIFLGDSSGNWNTTGGWNTFVGDGTGRCNTTGSKNVFLGLGAGYLNATGEGNVFLGYQAGYNETGSNKLYIANSDTVSPLIYGEFDNNIVTINGKLGIGTKNPAYAVEVNSTGTAANLVCKQTDGTSAVVCAGTSHVFIGAKSNHDFRLLANDSPKITILPSGNVGFGNNTPSYPLHMASGAYCSTGGTWTNASSRSLKENIQDLSTDEAVETLNQLNPVKYNYKVDKTDKHVGFIAEDVPELVAAADRKGLSPMDITAVLTRVVQEQQKMIREQHQVNQEYKKVISDLQERIAKIEKER